MYRIDRIMQRNNKEIVLITLTRKITLKLLNYGATIVEILVPDRNGNVENIVLTHYDINDYFNNKSYLGSTLGRTSGRISNGCFYLDGQLYSLNKNFYPHHGHGGLRGFSHRVWDYKVLESKNSLSVEFYYFSKDMEENYPGNLEVKVTYTLMDDSLYIEYQASSDKKTICNLTNHSYFNLSGNHKRQIHEQYLKIESDYFIEIDKDMIPTGKLVEVKDTPMDFRSFKLIGKDIDKDYRQLRYAKGYDHPFILRDKGKQIQMYDKISGRMMTITTTYPCVVVYTYNYPKGEILSNREKALKYHGITFETQYEPNGVNTEGFNTAVLNPKEKYYERTELRFSIN